MDLQTLLINVVTMIGVISGVLLGWALGKSRDAKEESELERLRRAYQEISVDQGVWAERYPSVRYRRSPSGS